MRVTPVPDAPRPLMASGKERRHRRSFRLGLRREASTDPMPCMRPGPWRTLPCGCGILITPPTILPVEGFMYTYATIPKIPIKPSAPSMTAILFLIVVPSDESPSGDSLARSTSTSSMLASSQSTQRALERRPIQTQGVAWSPQPPHYCALPRRDILNLIDGFVFNYCEAR